MGRPTGWQQRGPPRPAPSQTPAPPTQPRAGPEHSPPLFPPEGSGWLRPPGAERPPPWPWPPSTKSFRRSNGSSAPAWHLPKGKFTVFSNIHLGTNSISVLTSLFMEMSVDKVNLPRAHWEHVRGPTHPHPRQGVQGPSFCLGHARPPGALFRATPGEQHGGLPLSPASYVY